MATVSKRLGLIRPDTGEDRSRFEMAQADLLDRTFGSDTLGFRRGVFEGSARR